MLYFVRRCSLIEWIQLRDNLRKNDYSTQRALNEPNPAGRVARWKMEKADWDKATSYPTRKRLEALGLKNVADDLERIGKLGRGK